MRRKQEQYNRKSYQQAAYASTYRRSRLASPEKAFSVNRRSLNSRNLLEQRQDGAQETRSSRRGRLIDRSAKRSGQQCQTIAFSDARHKRPIGLNNGLLSTPSSSSLVPCRNVQGSPMAYLACTQHVEAVLVARTRGRDAAIPTRSLRPPKHPTTQR